MDTERTQHEFEDALIRRLHEFGLDVTPIDGRLGVDSRVDTCWLLRRGDSKRTFAVQLTGRARLSGAKTVSDTDPSVTSLIGAATVSRRSADALRRSGVQFVDLAGNAWIHFDNVLIDIRGRRPEPSAPKIDPADGVAKNLFSVGRSQVAFALLQWPELWHAPQRGIARAAGVSLGQAHEALTSFVGAGFGPGGHLDDEKLLDLWTAGFPSGLGPKLVLARFRAPIEHLEDLTSADLDLPSEAEVSGEFAASDRLRPTSLALYVEQLDSQLPIRNRWRSDGTPNVSVRRKFWSRPEGSEPEHGSSIRGFRLAPSMLVYAELIASSDSRVRNAASDWRRRAGTDRGL